MAELLFLGLEGLEGAAFGEALGGFGAGEALGGFGVGEALGGFGAAELGAAEALGGLTGLEGLAGFEGFEGLGGAFEGLSAAEGLGAFEGMGLEGAAFGTEGFAGAPFGLEAGELSSGLEGLGGSLNAPTPAGQFAASGGFTSPMSVLPGAEFSAAELGDLGFAEAGGFEAGGFGGGFDLEGSAFGLEGGDAASAQGFQPGPGSGNYGAMTGVNNIPGQGIYTAGVQDPTAVGGVSMPGDFQGLSGGSVNVGGESFGNLINGGDLGSFSNLNPANPDVAFSNITTGINDPYSSFTGSAVPEGYNTSGLNAAANAPGGPTGAGAFANPDFGVAAGAGESFEGDVIGGTAPSTNAPSIPASTPSTTPSALGGNLATMADPTMVNGMFDYGQLDFSEFGSTAQIPPDVVTQALNSSATPGSASAGANSALGGLSPPMQLGGQAAAATAGGVIDANIEALNAVSANATGITGPAAPAPAGGGYLNSLMTNTTNALANPAFLLPAGYLGYTLARGTPDLPKQSGAANQVAQSQAGFAQQQLSAAQAGQLSPGSAAALAQFEQDATNQLYQRLAQAGIDPRTSTQFQQGMAQIAAQSQALRQQYIQQMFQNATTAGGAASGTFLNVAQQQIALDAQFSNAINAALQALGFAAGSMARPKPIQPAATVGA